MSCKSARFAVVFSDPGIACDRETLCPAWSKADLGHVSISTRFAEVRRTNAVSSRLGELQWNEPATLDGVK